MKIPAEQFMPMAFSGIYLLGFRISPPDLTPIFWTPLNKRIPANFSSLGINSKACKLEITLPASVSPVF
jgi:hypothetical protein